MGVFTMRTFENNSRWHIHTHRHEHGNSNTQTKYTEMLVVKRRAASVDKNCQTYQRATSIYLPQREKRALFAWILCVWALARQPHWRVSEHICIRIVYAGAVNWYCHTAAVANAYSFKAIASAATSNAYFSFLIAAYTLIETEKNSSSLIVRERRCAAIAFL
jgi:hypothetical protein